MKKKYKFIYILFSIVIIFLIYYQFNNIKNKVTEKYLLNEYYIKDINKRNYNKIDSNNYIGVLEIPIINLKKGFFSIENKNNNINKNVTLIKYSKINNNDLFVFAAHSGNGIHSYFKDLDKLKINDDIILYYENQKYNYRIVNINNIEKDGNIEFKINATSTLILTTCNEKDKSKQIVIESILI